MQAPGTWNKFHHIKDTTLGFHGIIPKMARHTRESILPQEFITNDEGLWL
jgi:hypothetical protein